MVAAMKAGDTVKRNALRLMMAAIKQVEVDKRVTLDDAGVQNILTRQAKQRRESIADYENAGRPEQAAMQYRELQPIVQHFVDEPLVHSLAYWLHARGILATHDDAALAADDAALLNEADRIADDGQQHVKAWRQPN